MRKAAIAFVCVVLLAACASQKSQREGAQLLASHATNVQRELVAFSSRRTEIDKERYRDSRDLLASTLEAEAGNAAITTGWAADSKRLLAETLAATTASGDRAERAAAALKERGAEIAVTASLVNTRAEQLTLAAKALSGLARPDKLLHTLKFYRDFALEVRDAIEEAEKERQASTAKALQSQPADGDIR